MSKQIKVSEEMYDTLTRLKESDGHTSFDSVLRSEVNVIPENAPFEVPADYKTLTEQQALEIIDTWGNSAVDVDEARGTAQISTPPMTVQQIAIIVLRAALSASPVGSYMFRAAYSGAYHSGPNYDDPEFNNQQYRDQMADLRDVLERSGSATSYYRVLRELFQEIGVGDTPEDITQPISDVVDYNWLTVDRTPAQYARDAREELKDDAPEEWEWLIQKIQTRFDYDIRRLADAAP